MKDFIDALFEDVGKKIKQNVVGLFFGLLLLVIIVSVIFYIWSAETENHWLFFAGVLITVIGTSIVQWICYFLYGFGELVDRTNQICQHIRVIEKQTNANQGSTKPATQFEIKTKDIEDSLKQTEVLNCENVNIELIEAESYICGICGFSEPYDGNCPKCTSSIKMYLPKDNMENAKCDICNKVDNLRFAKRFSAGYFTIIKVCNDCTEKCASDKKSHKV